MAIATGTKSRFPCKCRDHVGLRVPPVLPALRDLLDPQAPLVRRALLGHRAHRGHKARLDLRGLRDPQERVETLDHRGTPVLKVPQAPQAPQERKASQVQTGRLGRRDKPARRVLRDLKGRAVTPAAPSSTHLGPRSGSQS